VTVKLGYLIPTRERVMNGHYETDSLLDLARRAEELGLDSLWLGDSLVAKPRHEPFTLMAAIAASTQRVQIGTAVLLPALRNPVILAHQVATLDRIARGRIILGVGIGGDVPPIRAEFTAAGVPFEKRVGTLLEGLRLCRALWRGAAVDWDGRWTLRAQTIGITPHRDGGPPIWVGSRVRAGIERAGRFFDGWFPTGPTPQMYRDQIGQVREVAAAAGRDPSAIDAATYLTVHLHADAAEADARVNDFLEGYYGQPASVIRRTQACFGGPESAVQDWLAQFVQAGVQHLVVRLVGDPGPQLEALVRIRAALNAGA
jgi:alkanesulfonate monooxygenase SsuD/methylene tetrahydromethanopterin reductase-like flavin-dependent oxidoreductase (luciferase family)